MKRYILKYKMNRYTIWDPETQKITEVYPLEECLEAIRIRFDDNAEHIMRLRKENEELRSEHFKDEQIQKLQNQIHSMQEAMNGFMVTSTQAETIKAWKTKHEASKHGLTDDSKRMKAHGAIGGAYTYTFCPTSIGTIGKIVCHCGDEFCFCDL